MFDHRALKWTSFLLSFHKYLFLIATLVMGAVVVTTRETATFHFFLFFTAFEAVLTFLVFKVHAGLRRRHSKSWTYATIISCLSLPTLFLPAAIMSLRELFNENLKAAYLAKPPVEPSPWADSFIVPKESSSTRNALLWTAGVVFVLVLLFNYFAAQPFRSEYSNLSREELYRKGAECNTYGKWECSLAVFERLVQLDPKDGTALANLAMAECKAGLYAKSVATAEKYFAQGGDAVDVMVYHGRALASLDRKEEALKWFALALSKEPKLVDVVQYMASILVEERRYEEGLALVEKFLEENPSAEEPLRYWHTTLKGAHGTSTKEAI